MFEARTANSVCGSESVMRRDGGRMLLGDNRRRSGHAAADQFSVKRILDFNRILMCVHIFDDMFIDLRVAPEFRK